MSKKIIVVGGGAAGMMAAIAAAEQGAQVTLLERNDTLGKKLGITGKGRCNLTNDCTEKELVTNMPGNGKFLFSAFHQMNSQQLQSFFQNLGVELKVERGKRVFPASDQASTILDALKKKLIQLDVEIRYGQRVQRLLHNQVSIQGVATDKAMYYADCVILATGGASYPTTGSTGDGYALAQMVGHTIIKPRPALIPLELDTPYRKALQGLSLKNVTVSIRNESAKLKEEFGEMLFTHFGVSGPVVLSLSRVLLDWNRSQNRILSIDLKPALSFEQLDNRIQRDFQKNLNKQFKNSLNELLPLSMIPVILEESKISSDKPVHSVTKEERQRLVAILKNLQFNISGVRPLAEAIVTTGGVDTKEIEPKTMASKKLKGLFFSGELIDIDGYTGGFNLQAAFSSGYAAGHHCVHNHDSTN